MLATETIETVIVALYHKERAGSSCHIHISLWDKEKNAFAGDKSFRQGTYSCGATRRGKRINHSMEIMTEEIFAPIVGVRQVIKNAPSVYLRWGRKR